MSEVKDFLGKGVRFRYNRDERGVILSTLYTTNCGGSDWIYFGCSKRNAKKDAPNKEFGLEIAKNRCDKAVGLFDVSRMSDLHTDVLVAKNGLYGVVRKSHVKDLISYFKNVGPRPKWLATIPATVTQL